MTNILIMSCFFINFMLMKNNLYYILSFLLFFLLFATSCNAPVSKEKPIAVEGKLDATQWDFEKDGILPLSGDWEFYWKQNLTPEDFKNDSHQADGFLYIPSFWNSFEVDNKPIGGLGSATYRLVLKSNVENEVLQLEKMNIMTSSKIWFNGKLISEVGNVTGNEKSSKPSTNYSCSEILLKKGDNEIILQIDNFSHRHGGTYTNIKIGKTKFILKEKRHSAAYDLFLVGSLFIMAIYHLALFYLRRKDISTLYFAIFAILIALRTLIIRDNFITEILPNISYIFKLRLEYLTFILAPPAVGLFLLSLYPAEFKKIPIYTVLGLAILSFTFVLIAPAYWFSFVVNPYQIVILFLLVYAIYGLIKAIIRKKGGAFIFLVGAVAVALTTVNDMLYVSQTINTIELIPWGLLVFIFAQSYIIALRFSKAFVRNEELTETLDFQNKNLEMIVDQRTTEIKQQNEEILAQKEELIAINDELTEMNEELENLSTIARETDNAIAIMDSNGKFEWMNEGSYRLYGYHFRDYIAKFGDNILQTSTNNNVKIAFNECINNKSSESYESSFITKSNNKIWIQTTLTPILDIKNNVVKVIGIDSDISDLKAFEVQILEKNDEISAQKDLLEVINDKIKYKNDQIKASIRYAQTIQQAILPVKEKFDQFFESFILFRPKDIVSGDFYWTNHLPMSTERKLTDKKFIAVVDCTGHGVPGAFMSMISSRLLSEIINEKLIFSPAEILTQLNKSIRKALKQDSSDNKDGLDMALCKIETDFEGKQTLSFAGAKRPVFIYQKEKKEFNVFKTTRKSIGGYKSKFNTSEYTETSIEINRGDIVYLTTDGYVDQNDEQRKRFGTNKLIDIIVENIDKDMKTQQIILEESLDKHMVNTTQRDDITVIGFKIK